MKRWHYLVIAAALSAVLAYFYFHPASFEFARMLHLSDSNSNPGGPARITWQAVERPADGFKLELPSDPKDLQVPAYNESGTAEPVNMLFSNPGGDTTFAISWEDNPPVARVNSHSPDRTLTMAKDGMLARTQTTPVSESRVTLAGGFPARDIKARNSDGGLLDARLIYTGNRLYVLMALFPSANVRREQDVIRFFNSFAPTQTPPIPESMPSASPNGH